MRLLFVVLALVSCACHRDPGEEPYAHASATFATLLSRNERLESPAFDDVLTELDRVPATSARAADAQRLAARIRNGRERPRGPLAVNLKPGQRAPELEAQLAACARLAEILGRDGGIDAHGLAALDDCRRKAEATANRLAHEGDPADHPRAPAGATP